jgi:hypothetical protein
MLSRIHRWSLATSKCSCALKQSPCSSATWPSRRLPRDSTPLNPKPAAQGRSVQASRGRYVPCSDACAVVLAVGSRVTRVRAGDRVCPIFAQVWNRPWLAIAPLRSPNAGRRDCLTLARVLSQAWISGEPTPVSVACGIQHATRHATWGIHTTYHGAYNAQRARTGLGELLT